MRVLNPNHLPEPYVRAVSEFRTPERGRISVTELITPPQLRSLLLLHWDDLEQQADDWIWAFFGTAVHERLAKFAGPHALAEEQLSWEVDGWTVHGTPDHAEWLGVEDGILTDWKTTTVKALGYERDEWVQQVNLYAHLLGLNGFKIGALRVKAFLRDWERNKLGSDPEYPRAPICEVPITMWDAQTTHEFLLERLKLHKRAARGLYGHCTDEERWKRGYWTVTKAGNTRATRRFPTQEMAEQFAEASTERPKKWNDWYSVEEVPGRPIRCLDWCPVAAHCDQWKEEQLESTKTPAEQGLGSGEHTPPHLSVVR